MVWTGACFALAAGLMWGLVFVLPLWWPEVPAAQLAFGRYLAFGLIALPLAWLDRRRLAGLTRADWREALRLSLVGNVLYYLLLASAIQRAGAPLPTVIIGTLPVVIALVSNRRNAARDGLFPWHRLALPLALIAVGIALVNEAELRALAQDPAADLGRYVSGAALAVGAMACWTWYPLRNADWLRAHPDRSPRTWATAQGLATLLPALLGTLALFAWGRSGGGTASPALGPDPWALVGSLLVVAVLSSWLATVCWNEASQRLPSTLAGQLIVFETLAALAYAYLLRGTWPDVLTLGGIALLVTGVVVALRVRPRPVRSLSQG